MEAKKKCDQCDSTTINGVFCHETGCPNDFRERSCQDCSEIFLALAHRARRCDECNAAWFEENET